MSEHTPTLEFSTVPVEAHQESDGSYTVRVKDQQTFDALACAYADHDELVAALPASPVDRLGELRAEIKALQDEAKGIERWLKSEATSLRLESPATFDGSLFTATVSTSERVTVDWKAVAAKLSPSHQLKSAHTKVKIITKVCVSAHKK